MNKRKVSGYRVYIDLYLFMTILENLGKIAYDGVISDYDQEGILLFNLASGIAYQLN